MDSLVTAAARALAAGDPLGALKRVALRDDAPALALRGIAMAQLGELERAKQLLRRAARAFGPRESVSRARCVAAEAEVALASRDLGFSPRALGSALETLEAHGDRVNALYARLVVVKRLLLIGRLTEAERSISGLDLRDAPAMLGAIGELLIADVALRHLNTRAARAALERAQLAAARAEIPALSAEVEQALGALERPAARLTEAGKHRLLLLGEVEGVLASRDLIVDACRRSVRSGRDVVSLAGRPVLFALARALAEAWPGDVARDQLLLRAFSARRANESYRARLRVEVGRLRKELAKLAGITATKHGFSLTPRAGKAVVVLSPPIDGDDAALLALLADGEAWSTSALALALGSSQRTVQRALSGLEEAGRVRSFGRARARRWLSPPVSGFTTTLLLPSALTAG
jgi:tetratricopeptide (TPR) repeat protein